LWFPEVRKSWEWGVVVGVSVAGRAWEKDWEEGVVAGLGGRKARSAVVGV